ncbi:MAG TPA: recombination regulator RecX [Alcaligenes sp.]|nr:recombination regulator RecX [Alcaligenes sp.]HRL25997.1 recombination regulator RecX [Alcaligenes sp.]
MILPGGFDDEPFETDPQEVQERRQRRRSNAAALSAGQQGQPGGDAGFESDFAADDDVATGASPKRAGPSLKARALNYLSRREYSRLELGRKLAAHADSPEQVASLLDELVAQKWLSDERFAQSLVNRRAARVGARVILQELRQHGLDAGQTDIIKEELAATELERAKQVWAKKFNAPPEDARAYAKQYRFMASRGFSSRILQQILGEWEDGAV